MRTLQHFINGSTVSGKSDRFGDIFNPNTAQVQARVPLDSRIELSRAVAAAEAAQPKWAALNPQRRARVLFRFKELVEARMDDIALLLSSEHGKVLDDSKGEIRRGLDVIEFVCGAPHLAKGEYSSGAGPDMDVWSMRQPLGVVAGITPFNFPVMIPMWMLGPALASGNSFVLKPSERDASVTIRLAELLSEAGLPDGIFNVVHGDKIVVDAIIDHPAIKAISFVGSSDIAQYVYAKGTATGKRVQAMGGAKNHAVIMPDANLDRAIPDIVGAAYGSAGERCMALPVVVPVGRQTAEELVERLVDATSRLRVGISTDAIADYGPLITGDHRRRVESYIQLAVDEGAKLVVDGRGFHLQGYESGFFLGPTLFDDVLPTMRSYNEEIFGPVLQIVRAESAEEGLALASKHQYGNGVAIFTRNGGTARRFAENVEVGMVGINVPIPVPVAYHSFGGWKRSGFGDHNQYGMDGVRFFTRTKVVTQRWYDEGSMSENQFLIPS